jgi:hypothetical protein
MLPQLSHHSKIDAQRFETVDELGTKAVCGRRTTVTARYIDARPQSVLRRFTLARNWNACAENP